MKVILKKPVKGLGEAGAVVEVNDGYGRNFLLPKGLAVEATAGNLNQREQARRRAEEQAVRALAAAKAAAQRIDGREVRIAVRSGQGGRLFGAVTTQAIAAAVRDQLGTQVDKRRVELLDPIKQTGRHRVVVRLHPQVEASLIVQVVEA